MRPRFVGRLGLADAITVGNAVIGFVAVIVAAKRPGLAARLVLLAAIADGLDGVVARNVGSTAVGEHLDSLSDVASFGVAPATIITASVIHAWGLSTTALSPRLAVAVGLPALFLAMVVVRLGLYNAYDTDGHETKGVPSTLAATIVAAVVLADVVSASVLLGLGGSLAYLMVTRITYPDLLARDAFLMGGVQGITVIAPDAFGRAFPYALLTLALAYLVLGPRFYWRPEESCETSDAAGGVTEI